MRKNIGIVKYKYFIFVSFQCSSFNRWKCFDDRKYITIYILDDIKKKLSRGMGQQKSRYKINN